MRFVLTETVDGYMKEIMDGLDFSGIEYFLNEHLRERISFSELVSQVAGEGVSALDAENICGFVFDALFYELSVAKPIFLKMLLFSVIFSVLQRLLATKNRYISDMGFLLIYATIMVLLMQSFFLVKDIAIEGMNSMLQFLNALIPVYGSILVFSGNAVTGAFFYELAFGLIYLIELALKRFLVPLIHIFVLVLFLNHLFDEDKLSKLANLMEKGIKLLLKASFGGIIGLSVVQSLITPAKDKVAGNVVLQGLSAIPGVGNTIGSAGELILSCGMLIKNSIGVVALIILVMVACAPVVKIGVFCGFYHLLGAVLQPVADRRITECVTAISRGCNLYLKIIVYSMLLFFILISMVGATTSFVN